MPIRMDFQPGCGRALHAGSTRRDSLDPLGTFAARRLPGTAPQLHDGALDQRLGLVSELSPAAALSQRLHALRYPSGARRVRAVDEPPTRQTEERNLASPISQSRRDHPEDESLL